MTRNLSPLVELGLIPFTPSREQVVANLNIIVFDLEKKRIARRTEKRMKMGDHPVAVMVIENKVMHRTDEYHQLLAMADVETSQANIVNVSKLVKDIEQYKENMSQMKETLRKERGEGHDLKRKHDDILSEFEKLKEAY